MHACDGRRIDVAEVGVRGVVRVAAREGPRIELCSVGEVLEHVDIGVHHAHADVAGACRLHR